jgi:nucleoside-diphosphate-sugar epimerase
MSRTVMVTGGTGYLGTAVVDELLSHGFELRLLVRDLERVLERFRGRVEVVQGDLLDPLSVYKAACGSDAVVHLAGIAADWVPDPGLFERINVQGTINVLDALKSARVPRLLITSTVMVFGPTDGLAQGSEKTRRATGAYMLPYQVTKARALALAKAARTPTLRVTVLYPGALYGPGPLTEGNYLARVMEMLATGGYPVLPKTGGVRWCLAQVADVARGHRLALERGAPDGDYILGGDNVPFERMLEIIRDGLALPALPPRVPGWAMLAGLWGLCLWHALWGTRPPMSLGGGRALLHDWAFSSAKAARELGYSWTPFEEGFPEFVRWYAALRRRPSPAESVAAVQHV